MADRNASTGGPDDGAPPGAPGDGAPLTGPPARQDQEGLPSFIPTTTTISTVAIQAGRAKIVLAILKSHEWIRVKIQTMEPDLMEVGTSLGEAVQLRRELDELCERLREKQGQVTELLTQADDLVAQEQDTPEQDPHVSRQVYQAMADSLSEAWKDLTAQLDYRRMLLDQSIAFHQSASDFEDRMEKAFGRFGSGPLATDVETARYLLQQHQEIKKGILEASKLTLEQGQVLLMRIREMGQHADIQSRHATTAACYGIEHLLELLHDRRRHLENLWLQRKIRLEQHLQLCQLDVEVNKISSWFSSMGDVYLEKTDVGNSVQAAHVLMEKHRTFEGLARDTQDTVLRLVRTADHLLHTSSAGADEIRVRLTTIDDRCEDFMIRVDARRKNLQHAGQFFRLADDALVKLDQLEQQLQSVDLPRGSAMLAEKCHHLSSAVSETTVPALHHGRVLIERMGADDRGADGVRDKMNELQTRIEELEERFHEHMEGAEKTEIYNTFIEKYTRIHHWLVQVGLAVLTNHRDLGSDLYRARDFLEIHERLLDDIKSLQVKTFADRESPLDDLQALANELAQSGDQDADHVAEKLRLLIDDWSEMRRRVEIRIQISVIYVHFLKISHQLLNHMDGVEDALKSQRHYVQEVGENFLQHLQERWRVGIEMFVTMETKADEFKDSLNKVDNDPRLETDRADVLVETTVTRLRERKEQVTNLMSVYQEHVTSGREFKSQWHQFVQDARKTIDWIMKIENELFPEIAGQLGSSRESTSHYQTELAKYDPIRKRANEEIEAHLKTAETLSLKGDTKGQKDQIVNELLKVHQRFQARIAEYKVLLNMTIAFFKNLEQLDQLIERTEREYEGNGIPTELQEAERALRNHLRQKEQMGKLFEFTADEGEQIVVRVRQQDSEEIATKEVQSVMNLADERRHNWEKTWEDQRSRLEQSLQICQFNHDLRQINQDLDALTRELQHRRSQIGVSRQQVAQTADNFKHFKETIPVIEKKLQNFVSTAELMLRDQHYDSQHIREQLDMLQHKFATLQASVNDHGDTLQVSQDFFHKIEEAEDWIREGSQLLNSIGRNATSCKTPEDTEALMNNVKNFVDEGKPKQEERIAKLSQMAQRMYGPQAQNRVRHVLVQFHDMLDAFSTADKQLSSLHQALSKHSQVLEEQQQQQKLQPQQQLPVEEMMQQETAVKDKAVPIEMETDGPITMEMEPGLHKDRKAPRLIQPLKNADVFEGMRFTFECRFDTDGQKPEIVWYKGNIPLTSPDYETRYDNGLATLTIEETFSEDTARYTCKCNTHFGSAETSAQLTVRETETTIQAPDFLKQLKSVDLVAGTAHVLECQVTGCPSPVVSWFKDDYCIDQSPEYVITKINGTCCLKIRKVGNDHQARFTCKASNSGGEAATSARITVLPAECPVVTENLQDVTQPEGKPVRVQCRFTANPQPDVTWLRGSEPVLPSSVFKITIETNMTSLEITEAYPEDTGTYTVVLRNPGGEARTTCTITIESSYQSGDSMDEAETQAPYFTAHLQDQEVMEGGRVRLDCIVVANPEPEVIWYKHEKPVKESQDFQLLFEGDRCTLVIREAYLEDSGTYRCLAKNTHGQADSTATLHVEPLSELSDVGSITSLTSEQSPPKFVQILKDTTCRHEERVQLSCRVVGQPAPQVLWYKDDKPIRDSQDFIIDAEGEHHTLTIPEVFSDDGGVYQAKAVSPVGEAKCYAQLSIQATLKPSDIKAGQAKPSYAPKPFVPKPEPGAPQEPMFKLFQAPKKFAPPQAPAQEQGKAPEFTRLFQDKTVQPGEEVSFECTVTGQPKPKVTWCFDGRPILNKDYQITDTFNNHRLHIPEVFDEDSGRFSVTAENSAGRATCSALLQVEEAAPPRPPPVEGYLKPSAAKQRAKSPPTLKKFGVTPWEKKPEPPVRARTPDKPWSPEKAPWSPVKTPWSAPAEETSPSKAFLVEQPVFPASPASQIKTGPKFSPKAPRKWAVVSEEEPEPVSFIPSNLQPKSPLSKPEIFSSQKEKFKKELHPKGYKPVDFTIAVPVPPEFVEPLKNIAAEEGARVVFDGVVRGEPVPVIKWYREGREITDQADYEISFQHNRVSLHIREVFEEDAGKFTCQAVNLAGKASSTAELIIKASAVPPEFLERLQPKRRVREGESVRLIVRVAGRPTPEVKWYRDGQHIVSSPDFHIITDQDFHTLYIPEAQKEDSAKFTVTAENMLGAKDCSTELTVDPRSPLGSEPRYTRQDSGPQFKVRLPVTPKSEAKPVWQPKSPPSKPRTPTKTPPKTPPRLAPGQEPQFVRTLQNTQSREGQRVTLECEVTAVPEPMIKWFREDAEIHNSPDFKISYQNGRCRLVIDEVFTEDSGKFTCTATNPLGTKSTFCYVKVEPVGEVIEPRRLPPVEEPPVTPSKSPLVKAPPLFPIKAPPVKAPAPPTGPQVGPSFVRRPEDCRLIPGANAYFDCKVSGSPMPEVYWLRHGAELPDTPRYKKYFDEDTGEATLLVYQVTADDAGEYTCVCSSPLGEITHNSILMHHDLSPWRPDEPVKKPVHVQPKFEAPRDVKAMLSPRPVQEKPMLARPQPPQQAAPTAPDSEFVVSTFEQRLMKEIEFRVGRTSGSESMSEYDSDVYTEQPHAPDLVQKMKDFKLIEGTDATFVCKVKAYPRPKIQWFRNGILLRPSQKYIQHVSKDGYCTLRIRNATYVDYGYYTILVKNRDGRDTCSAQLYVEGVGSVDEASYVDPKTMQTLVRMDSRDSMRRPEGEGGIFEKHQKPVFRKTPENQEVREGNMCRFDSLVSARPIPEFTWYRDGIIVPDDSNHKVVVNESGVHSLIINSVARYDAGTYTCVAQNRAGEDRFTVTLNVLEKQMLMPPRFTDRIVGAQVNENESVTFTCRLQGVPQPMLSWQRDGRNLPNNENYVITFENDTSTLHIVRCTREDNAWFQCSAVNIGGTASTRAKLNVHCTSAPKEPERKLVFTKTTRRRPEPQEPMTAPNWARPSLKHVPEEEQFRPLPDYITQRQVELPSPADMFDKDKKRPPKFKRPLANNNTDEMEPAHFETRLVPVGDPDMKVEWYHNEELLRHGHRFMTTKDFAYISLDILWTYPEDDGEYWCRATNLYGEDKTNRATLHCKGKKSVITESQLPEGMATVQMIQRLESQRDKESPEAMQADRPKEEPSIAMKPEAVTVDEGESAKFIAKVHGFPRPKVLWWLNGAIIAPGNRFTISYDGMIHYLEVHKCRDYDSGTIQISAKNPLGEVFTSTELTVKPHQDWRARLRKTDRPEFDTNPLYAQEMKNIELQLSMAPKTSIVDILPLERAPAPRETETQVAQRTIQLKHSELQHVPPSFELRQHSPTMETQAEVHVERARAQLQLMQMEKMETERKIKKVVVLERKEPPVFTKRLQPVRVSEGSPVTLEVEFTGIPVPKISWFREGFEIQPSRDFQVTTTENTSTLYVPEVFPEDAGQFVVLAENPNGKANTKARVTVIEELPVAEEPPQFRSLPRDTTVKQGEPATFDCEVVGKEPITIQWRKHGTPMVESPDWKYISEYGHHTLLLYETKPQDQGQYSVHASNNAGTVDASARLTLIEPSTPVEAAPEPPQMVPQQKPVLMTPLRNLTVEEGNPAVFTCNIKASPAPVITWYLGNQPVKPSKYFKMTSDGNTHTLAITEAFPEDEASYRCSAVNPRGEVSTVATLSVKPLLSEPEMPSGEPPRFVKPIAGLDLIEGSPAKFEAVVTGKPEPVLQWLREGEVIQPSTDFMMFKDDNKHTLFIQEAYPEDSGIFTCRAINESGVAECSAELFVEETTGSESEAPHAGPERREEVPAPDLHHAVLTAPFFEATLNDIEVEEGQPVHFECQVVGQPMPEVTWLLDSIEITDTKVYRMSSTSEGVCSLDIAEAFPEDEGEYTVRAENEFGTTETSAELIVRAPTKEEDVSVSMTLEPQEEVMEEVDVTLALAERPEEDVEAAFSVPIFTKPLPETTPAKDASSVTLHCQVQGEPRPQITWTHNNQPVQKSADFIQEFVNEDVTLTIKEVFPEDAGVYVVEAKNKMGKATSTTVLEVEEEEVSITLPAPTKETEEEEVEVEFTVAPVFTKPLEDTTVLIQNTITLTCQVTGQPRPQITIQKDGKELKPSKRTTIEISDDGTITIVIIKCTADDEGDYSITAVNKVGSAKTTCEVLVNEPPRFSKPLQDITINVRDTGKFTCDVVAMPEPQTSWFVSGVEIQETPKYHIESHEETHTLEIRDVTTEDDDQTYTVKATNQYGQAESTAKLTVTVPPRILKWPGTIHFTPAKKETVTIDITFEGDAPVKIEWKRGKKAVRPTKYNKYDLKNTTTTTTLTITECTKEEADTYTVYLENKHGKDKMDVIVTDQPRTEPESIEVTDERVVLSAPPTEAETVEPPKFTLDIKTTTATQGEKARLFGTVVGAPRPTVLWKKDGKQLRKGDNRFVIEYGESGDVSLVILEIISGDAGEYLVEATNKLGKAVSEAPLIVQTPPVITKKPDLLTITELERSSFLCNITGNPRPTVTWSRGDEILTDEKQFHIEDYDETFLFEINKTMPTDQGVYTVTAVNPAGQATAHIKLNVEHSQETAAEVIPTEVKKEAPKSPTILRHKESTKPPEFTEVFKDVTIDEDDTLTLKCKVIGVPRPDVTWYRGEEKIVPSKQVKISHEEDICKLVVTKAPLAAGGKYTCVAVNSAGDAKIDANVIVSEYCEPPEFTRELRDDQVKLGRPCKLECKATGIPTPEYEWFHGDTPIKASAHHKLESKYNKKDLETTVTLTIDAIKDDEHGVYKCVAKNVVGDATTECRITIEQKKEAPKFVRKPENVECYEGQTATFDCEIHASPEPTVSWNFGDKPVKPGDRVKTDQKDKTYTFVLEKTVPKDSGLYNVRAQNEAGSQFAQARLKVLASKPPKFEKKPENVKSPKQGKAQFSCKVSGVPTPELTWYLHGDKLEPSDRVKFDYDKKSNVHSVVIENTEDVDEGQLKIVATNCAGEATAEAKLEVKGLAPKFIVEPLKCVILEKQTCVFKTRIVGEPNPKIEWSKGKWTTFKHGGRTKIYYDDPVDMHVIEIADIKDKDAGAYQCKISNQFGSETCSVTLMVTKDEAQVADWNKSLKHRDAPVKEEWDFTKPLEDLTVKEKQNAIFEVETSVKNAPTEWFVNGEKVIPSAKHQVEIDGTKQRLIVNNCTKGDECLVSCTLKEASTEGNLTVVGMFARIPPKRPDKMTIGKQNRPDAYQDSDLVTEAVHAPATMDKPDNLSLSLKSIDSGLGTLTLPGMDSPSPMKETSPGFGRSESTDSIDSGLMPESNMFDDLANLSDIDEEKENNEVQEGMTKSNRPEVYSATGVNLPSQKGGAKIINPSSPNTSVQSAPTKVWEKGTGKPNGKKDSVGELAKKFEANQPRQGERKSSVGELAKRFESPQNSAGPKPWNMTGKTAANYNNQSAKLPQEDKSDEVALPRKNTVKIGDPSRKMESGNEDSSGQSTPVNIPGRTTTGKKAEVDRPTSAASSDNATPRKKSGGLGNLLSKFEPQPKDSSRIDPPKLKSSSLKNNDARFETSPSQNKPFAGVSVLPSKTMSDEEAGIATDQEQAKMDQDDAPNEVSKPQKSSVGFEQTTEKAVNNDKSQPKVAGNSTGLGKKPNGVSSLLSKFEPQPKESSKIEPTKSKHSNREDGPTDSKVSPDNKAAKSETKPLQKETPSGAPFVPPKSMPSKIRAEADVSPHSKVPASELSAFDDLLMSDEELDEGTQEQEEVEQNDTMHPEHSAPGFPDGPSDTTSDRPRSSLSEASTYSATLPSEGTPSIGRLDEVLNERPGELQFSDLHFAAPSPESARIEPKVELNSNQSPSSAVKPVVGNSKEKARRDRSPVYGHSPLDERQTDDIVPGEETVLRGMPPGTPEKFHTNRHTDLQGVATPATKKAPKKYTRKQTSLFDDLTGGFSDEEIEAGHDEKDENEEATDGQSEDLEPVVIHEPPRSVSNQPTIILSPSKDLPPNPLLEDSDSEQESEQEQEEDSTTTTDEELAGRRRLVDATWPDDAPRSSRSFSISDEPIQEEDEEPDDDGQVFEGTTSPTLSGRDVQEEGRPFSGPVVQLATTGKPRSDSPNSPSHSSVAMPKFFETPREKDMTPQRPSTAKPGQKPDLSIRGLMPRVRGPETDQIGSGQRNFPGPLMDENESLNAGELIPPWNKVTDNLFGESDVDDLSQDRASEERVATPGKSPRIETRRAFDFDLDSTPEWDTPPHQQSPRSDSYRPSHGSATVSIDMDTGRSGLDSDGPQRSLITPPLGQSSPRRSPTSHGDSRTTPESEDPFASLNDFDDVIIEKEDSPSSQENSLVKTKTRPPTGKTVRHENPKKQAQQPDERGAALADAFSEILDLQNNTLPDSPTDFDGETTEESLLSPRMLGTNDSEPTKEWNKSGRKNIPLSRQIGLPVSHAAGNDKMGREAKQSLQSKLQRVDSDDELHPIDEAEEEMETSMRTSASPKVYSPRRSAFTPPSRTGASPSSTDLSQAIPSPQDPVKMSKAERPQSSEVIRPKPLVGKGDLGSTRQNPKQRQFTPVAEHPVVPVTNGKVDVPCDEDTKSEVTEAIKQLIDDGTFNLNSDQSEDEQETHDKGDEGATEEVLGYEEMVNESLPVILSENRDWQVPNASTSQVAQMPRPKQSARTPAVSKATQQNLSSSERPMKSLSSSGSAPGKPQATSTPRDTNTKGAHLVPADTAGFIPIRGRTVSDTTNDSAETLSPRKRGDTLSSIERSADDTLDDITDFTGTDRTLSFEQPHHDASFRSIANADAEVARIHSEQPPSTQYTSNIEPQMANLDDQEWRIMHEPDAKKYLSSARGLVSRGQDSPTGTPTLVVKKSGRRYSDGNILRHFQGPLPGDTNFPYLEIQSGKVDTQAGRKEFAEVKPVPTRKMSTKGIQVEDFGADTDDRSVSASDSVTPKSGEQPEKPSRPSRRYFFPSEADTMLLQDSATRSQHHRPHSTRPGHRDRYESLPLHMRPDRDFKRPLTPVRIARLRHDSDRTLTRSVSPVYVSRSRSKSPKQVISPALTLPRHHRSLTPVVLSERHGPGRVIMEERPRYVSVRSHTPDARATTPVVLLPARARSTERLRSTGQYVFDLDIDESLDREVEGYTSESHSSGSPRHSPVSETTRAHYSRRGRQRYRVERPHSNPMVYVSRSPSVRSVRTVEDEPLYYMDDEGRLYSEEDLIHEDPRRAPPTYSSVLRDRTHYRPRSATDPYLLPVTATDRRSHSYETVYVESPRIHQSPRIRRSHRKLRARSMLASNPYVDEQFIPYVRGYDQELNHSDVSVESEVFVVVSDSEYDEPAYHIQRPHYLTSSSGKLYRAHHSAEDLGRRRREQNDDAERDRKRTRSSKESTESDKSYKSEIKVDVKNKPSERTLTFLLPSNDEERSLRPRLNVPPTPYRSLTPVRLRSHRSLTRPLTPVRVLTPVVPAYEEVEYVEEDEVILAEPVDVVLEEPDTYYSTEIRVPPKKKDKQTDKTDTRPEPERSASYSSYPKPELQRRHTVTDPNYVYRGNADTNQPKAKRT